MCRPLRSVIQKHTVNYRKSVKHADLADTIYSAIRYLFADDVHVYMKEYDIIFGNEFLMYEQK